MELDGRHLETSWWGNPEPGALTLVLLHEGLGSVGLWREFLQRLAQATGCPVFAYSRFGYGHSASTQLPRPLSYMHDEAQQVLGRVLDAAGSGPFMLVGHSDGASIASLYAGSRQDFRLRGLVLIAPHFFVEDVTIASIEAARKAYEQGDLRTRLGRHHDDVDAAFRGWAGAWLDPGFRSWDITDHLAYIRAPILLLQGDADPYGTPAQLRAAEDNTYCPLQCVLFAGLGHAPHQEDPAATIAAIREFVEHLQYNA